MNARPIPWFLLKRVLIGTVLLFCAACAPSSPPPPPSPTGISQTESAQSVVSPTPSPTIDWFPVTDLPTLPAPVQPTPTSAIFPELGALIFEDDFQDSSLWTLTNGPRGSAALGVDEMTIVLNQEGAYVATTRLEPVLDDFYLEVNVRANLCAGFDEFGVLLRMASQGDFYRFSVSCNGQMRMDLIRGGTATAPLSWTPSAAVPSNAPSTFKLGAWASGETMYFFINDTFQVEVPAPFILQGGMGFFARSRGQNAVTVNFSELRVWEVAP